MAFLQVQFFSRALNVASTVNVILPEPNQGIGIEAAQNGELPKVLYLLHGFSDDHSIWMRRTSIERYAASYNLAVIMPAVNHSFYCNEACGEKYWDYVSEELPATMHRFFKLSDRAEDTFVAGLSMGGYGAMRLGLTFPKRFAKVGTFSGAVDLVREIKEMNEDKKKRWSNIHGDLSKVEGSEVDLRYLVKKNAEAETKPDIYLACGTADFLYQVNREFVPYLRENGWNVKDVWKDGATHEWGFWDEQVRLFLEWALEG